MKKITIAEYLKCISTEELIDMISDTGSWDDIFDDMRTSCHEDLHNSVFDSSLEEMKEYITNELTYFINDDENDINEFKEAIIHLEGGLPLWLLVKLRSYLKTAKTALRDAVDENNRRMGFDI